MLNNVIDIPYKAGIEKYLPEYDRYLKLGEKCWYLFDNRFLCGVLVDKHIDGNIVVRLIEDDFFCRTVGVDSVFSDKTLAEAIEKLAIEEINKDLETVAQKEQSEFDPVKKPKHYMLFPEAGIEVRDLVKLLLNRASSNGFNDPMFLSDQAQMLQYILRFDAKNGKEDLEKARWYLDKMIGQLVDN